MGRALVTQIERQNRNEKSKILQKIYNFLSREHNAMGHGEDSALSNPNSERICKKKLLRKR